MTGPDLNAARLRLPLASSGSTSLGDDSSLLRSAHRTAPRLPTHASLQRPLSSIPMHASNGTLTRFLLPARLPQRGKGGAWGSGIEYNRIELQRMHA